MKTEVIVIEWEHISSEAYSEVKKKLKEAGFLLYDVSTEEYDDILCVIISTEKISEIELDKIKKEIKEEFDEI